MSGDSALLIELVPLGVYDTQALRMALGESLWLTISPKVPRLCKGSVMGEDVLKALRELAKANLDKRNEHPRPDPRRRRTRALAAGKPQPRTAPVIRSIREVS